MKRESKEMEKPGADLLLNKPNTDPEGNIFYHPIILKGCVTGAVLIGILFSVIAYLLACGIFPVKGLEQIAAASSGAIFFFGFISGSALGGLIGSIYGLFIMLRKKQ